MKNGIKKSLLVGLLFIAAPCVAVNFERKRHEQQVLHEMTPLMEAAFKSDAARVVELIQDGVDVNAQFKKDDGYPWTALMYASLTGNKKIIKELLVAGAIRDFETINAKDNERFPKLSLVEEIANKIEPDALAKQLLEAAGLADLDGVEDALEHFAYIEAKDKQGHTALAFAALLGNKEIVDALIKAGANVNAQNNAGDSVIILAAQQDHRDVVDALVKAGVDSNAKNNFGKSARDYAGPNVKNLLEEPERKAAAEKKAAEEKAAQEKKAADEKAAADKVAADKKLADEKAVALTKK
ncbi:MAG: ankyrin repeat domain-containing protein [Candidatus Dependentiae bacterium]|nr:ankyrin repeat domain-containing protein [Candidatus Dependentiae bacterium]